MTVIRHFALGFALLQPIHICAGQIVGIYFRCTSLFLRTFKYPPCQVKQIPEDVAATNLLVVPYQCSAWLADGLFDLKAKRRTQSF
ncbi:MAG: hypothetical protein JWQ21_819 [Herminiimonas sp.]|nr:hypothetical protein [Herminiimonas sp.]